MMRLVAGSVVSLALTVACPAADLSITMTSKPGQIGNYDWAGAYGALSLATPRGLRIGRPFRRAQLHRP